LKSNQIEYQPLLIAFVKDKTIKKKINTLEDLCNIIGIKEIVHLWDEILNERKLVLEVNQSYKSRRIKVCTRDYYYCFIPRLRQAAAKIENYLKT
jgi:hypothetical protein